MSPETLTAKLHARADKKLRDYCHARLGDLFDTVRQATIGGGTRPPLTDTMARCLRALGAKETETPWHPCVWDLAKETLFVYLQESWREREVREFMEKVEAQSDEIESIREEACHD